MSGTVLFEGGDTLTEANVQRAFARVGNSHYVNSGLHFTPDYQAAVLDISGGIAYILDDGRDYTTFPDPAAGLALPTDGVAHVWLTYDPSIDPEAERLFYTIENADTPPDGPSLKVGTVDMGAQSYTELNRNPPVNDEDAETVKGNDIDSDGDGVVDASDTAASADVADRATTVGSSDPGASADELLHADGSVTPTDALPMDNHSIEDIGTTVWQSDDGTREMRGAVRDTDDDGVADLYRLTPVVDGTVRTGSALRYDFSAGRWITGGGTHRIVGSEGTLDLSTAAANRARLLPVSGGSALYDKEFYYHYGDGQWKFQPTVVFGAETANQVSVRTGNGLARLTPQTPNGPEFNNELYFDFETRRWGADTQFDATADAAGGLTRTARGQFVQRAPNDGFEQTTVPDTEDARKVVFTPGGEYLYLWVWGCTNSSGNSPAGLDIAAYYASGGSEIDRTGSARAPGGSSPIFKTNSAVQFRLENTTGSPQDASAQLGYTFEED